MPQDRRFALPPAVAAVLSTVVTLSAALITGADVVRGQASVTIFDPEPIPVELGAPETRPRGADAEILVFGLDAGGGAGLPDDGTVNIEWALNENRTLPPTDDRQQMPTACGYPEGDSPVITLTTPSGESREVPAVAVRGVQLVEYFRCWTFDPPDVVRMELGEYGVEFAHSAQTLNTAVTFALPPGPTEVVLKDGDRLLLGFQPQEQIVAHFYRKGEAAQFTYLATRTIPADDTGSAYLEVNLDTPDAAAQTFMLIDGYNKGENLESLITPFYEQATCPDDTPSRLYVNTLARVDPGPGLKNRVRAVPENGRIITTIDETMLFYVTEGPVCGQLYGFTWWKIRALDTDENGQPLFEGWTAEASRRGDYWLQPVYGALVGGSR